MEIPEVAAYLYPVEDGETIEAAFFYDVRTPFLVS